MRFAPGVSFVSLSFRARFALAHDAHGGHVRHVRHGGESWMGIMDGHHGGIMLHGCVLWSYGWMGVMAHTAAHNVHSMTLLHWIHIYLFI